MDLRRWLFVWLCIASSSCGEPQCPDGFDKVGNSCRRQPEGGTVDPAQADPGDGNVGATAEAGSAAGDGAPAASSLDATTSTEAGSALDATSAIPVADAGASNADAQGPSAECDDQRRCSAGYTCEAGRCASACERKQCDPNATCSLMGATPACTCNSGFIAQGQACIRDIACEELNCSRNGTCEVGSDALRRCVCKNGYVGNGKTCEPVSCPPASGLSIPNGTVSTPNGTTFGQSAIYMCATGYGFVSGDAVRMCQDNGGVGIWSGAAPACVLSCTINDSCKPGDACVTDPDCGSGNVCAGGRCLIEACSGGEFTSADKIRNCKTVNGDLVLKLTASGAASLDFPNTTEISGNLSISAQEVISSKRTVSFGALNRVGGGLDIGPAVAGDIVGVAAIEVALPKLTSVDLNLRVMLAETLRVLKLPALTTVGGSFYLQYLDRLQTLQLDSLQSVQGQMSVLLVPNVGMSPVFTRLAGVLGAKLSTQGLGCCLPTNGSADCASRTPPTTCW